MSEFFIPLKKQATRTTKVTLENIMKINPFFDDKNPVTYKIFLKARPDLSCEEVEHYVNLIYNLELELQDEIHCTNLKMRDSRLVFAETLLADVQEQRKEAITK